MSLAQMAHISEEVKTTVFFFEKEQVFKRSPVVFWLRNSDYTQIHHQTTADNGSSKDRHGQPTIPGTAGKTRNMRQNSLWIILPQW